MFNFSSLIKRPRIEAKVVAGSLTTTAIAKEVKKQSIINCCARQNSIIFSCLAVLLFVWFLVPFSHILLAWLITGTLLVTLRFIFTFWFEKYHITNPTHFHVRTFTLIMLLWGGLWAVGTILFFPHLSTLQQAAWFAMFMAMVASSSSSHAVCLPAFYAFSVPYFLAMGWMVMTEFPSSFHVNGIVFIFVMVSQTSSTIKSNRVLHESFRLRFENLDLIEELKKQKESAEQANLAKSKFLAAASHDLRQPLHALTLFGSALQDSLDDKQKSIDLIRKINASVDALQELFNALLDISRLDAGTLICEKIHFSSSELFSKLDNDFQQVAQAKGLSLEWEKSDYLFYSDPTLLQLIMRNLVSNALRYTQTGGVRIEVNQSADTYRIEVIDTGIGIAPEQQTKVFDEFVQLHNPERDRKKGLGLGLSIVKRVVALIGSKISLDSKLGQGARFCVEVRGGNANLVETHTRSTQVSTANQSANIVVIDDELAILEAMQALLSGWGYQVFAAGDVTTAMAMLNDKNAFPDCVVADYRLRNNATGVQAIDTLRATYGKSLPALIVSGDIAPERLQLVKEAGLTMLHKPVPPAKLRSFLKNQI